MWQGWGWIVDKLIYYLMSILVDICIRSKVMRMYWSRYELLASQTWLGPGESVLLSKWNEKCCPLEIYTYCTVFCRRPGFVKLLSFLPVQSYLLPCCFCSLISLGFVICTKSFCVILGVPICWISSVHPWIICFPAVPITNYIQFTAPDLPPYFPVNNP